MIILYVLIPLSIILVAFALWAFFWAVRHGQFDDLKTPALSILAEEDLAQQQQDENVDEPK